MPNNKDIGPQADGYYAEGESDGDDERYRPDNREQREKVEQTTQTQTRVQQQTPQTTTPPQQKKSKKSG
jgi:hypothetical protein